MPQINRRKLVVLPALFSHSALVLTTTSSAWPQEERDAFDRDVFKIWSKYVRTTATIYDFDAPWPPQGPQEAQKNMPNTMGRSPGTLRKHVVLANNVCISAEK